MIRAAVSGWIAGTLTGVFVLMLNLQSVAAMVMVFCVALGVVLAAVPQ